MLQQLNRHLEDTLQDMENYYRTFIDGVQQERISVFLETEAQQAANIKCKQYQSREDKHN